MNQPGCAALHRESTQCAETYCAEVLRSPTVDQLTDLARQVAPYTTVLDPRFFIGSLGNSWMPRIVLVRHGLKPVGLVYAKEKVLAGVPTGVLYADSTLGNLVLTDKAHEQEVLSVALQKLLALRRLSALRLLLPPTGYEHQIARDVARSMGLDTSEARDVLNHARLRLTPTYEAFLALLGYRTRRNFRYYRRRFEAAGHQFVRSLSHAEMCDAVIYLRTKCRIQTSNNAVERLCNWVAAVDRPFACGLRTQGGDWLSVAAGF